MYNALCFAALSFGLAFLHRLGIASRTQDLCHAHDELRGRLC